MNQSTNVPVTFWIIAVIALLWNLMGLMAFGSDMTMSPEKLAEMEPAMRSYYETNPLWNKIAFGVATICGVLGSVGLLMKKPWSETLFLLSILGVLANTLYSFFLSDVSSNMTGPQMGLSAMVLLIALFLWYYSKKCKVRGWIAE